MTIRFLHQVVLKIEQQGRIHTRTFFQGDVVEVKEVELCFYSFVDGRISIFDNSVFAILLPG